MVRFAASVVLICFSVSTQAEPGVVGGERGIRFVDITEQVGLGGLAAARVAFADLNGNGRPDVVIDRHRVFLNTPDAEAPLGFRFVELAETGLPLPSALGAGDCIVFADLDNDGVLDAIVTRNQNVNRDGFEPPEHPSGTAWLRGKGDGTFGEPRIIDAAKPATTSSIAVGDVNLDGRLDLYLGNWYTAYGQSLEGFTNDLLVQTGEDGRVAFVRQPLAEDEHEFDPESDLAGRPTYGVMIANVVQWAPYADVAAEESMQGLSHPDNAQGESLPPLPRGPQLLELNYGRRANRLWDVGAPVQPLGRELAPIVGFDGDDIRHGRHPEWLKIIAQRDPRFDRQDEKPFRSHGNTFDVAVGDVTNNGEFDLFLAEITHGWAGDSSDLSRLLVSGRTKSDPTTIFEPSPHSFDRIPPIPPEEEWAEGWFPRWNHGDLFCEFADLDNDGLLDLILSSGDYPDPAPYDQRLRIYRQSEDGLFTDVTAASGIDHIGSQQLSLGDVNGNGQLDILVGQTFTRFTPAMIEAAGGKPRVRLFMNQTYQTHPAHPTHQANAEATPDRQTEPPHLSNSITLKLVGDPQLGVNRDALGAIVRLHIDPNSAGNGPGDGGGGRAAFQSRQLIGIGGHAGKQHQFLVHFGLDDAKLARKIEIHWPGQDERITILEDVPPGHHVVNLKP